MKLLILLLLLVPGALADNYFYAEEKIVAFKDDQIRHVYQDRIGTDIHSNQLPFGQEISAGTNKFTFVGKELDSDLYYFGARYQNPDTGRFISVDPVEGQPAYAYVANNPLNLQDPTGTVIELNENAHNYFAENKLNLNALISASPALQGLAKSEEVYAFDFYTTEELLRIDPESAPESMAAYAMVNHNRLYAKTDHSSLSNPSDIYPLLVHEGYHLWEAMDKDYRAKAGTYKGFRHLAELTANIATMFEVYSLFKNGLISESQYNFWNENSRVYYTRQAYADIRTYYQAKKDEETKFLTLQAQLHKESRARLGLLYGDEATKVYDHLWSEVIEGWKLGYGR